MTRTSYIRSEDDEVRFVDQHA